MRNIDFRNLINPAIIMFVGFIAFLLISLINIIYNKIFYKITFKEWFDERKYFFLFYLYSYIMMIVMIFLMLFGLLGIFAAILILTTAGGIMGSIKNNTDFYIEEATSYRCQCGRNITQVIKIKISGKRKLLYYICRDCQKKYSKNELESSKK